LFGLFEAFHRQLSSALRVYRPCARTLARRTRMRQHFDPNGILARATKNLPISAIFSHWGGATLSTLCEVLRGVEYSGR
jgi:hypothetical protein